MISLKKRNQEKGFTIVELLIVIVVIGILALLVITTYGGIQAKARNSKRQADLQAVATQIEAYYSQNQHYPSLEQMNDADWREDNMKSLDAQALVDPSSTDPDSATPLAAAKAKGVYAYAPLTDADGACETTPEDCAQYTLTATFEGTVNGATEYVKKNLD